MNILLVLIPVTAIVVGIAVAVFFWAVNHQQFDDLESPAVLPLLDDPDQGAPSGDPADSGQSGPDGGAGDAGETDTHS